MISSLNKIDRETKSLMNNNQYKFLSVLHDQSYYYNEGNLQEYLFHESIVCR